MAYGSKRFSGADELLTAVAEQARVDLTYSHKGQGSPYCTTDHVNAAGEVTNSPILREPPLLDPRWTTTDGRPRPHRIKECGLALLQELNVAIERKQDPMAALLEIVSR